jgi:hypothetical protein
VKALAVRIFDLITLTIFVVEIDKSMPDGGITVCSLSRVFN